MTYWQVGLRSYLRWLDLCHSEGVKPAGTPERLKSAVESAGARRGLGLRTRQRIVDCLLRIAD